MKKCGSTSSLFPFFPFVAKPKTRYWFGCRFRGSWRSRRPPYPLGLAPAPNPRKQRRGGCGGSETTVCRRLDILHRPVGLKVASAQGLRSPALRKQTACCSALVRPAMKLRSGRNAACFRAPALCVPGYGNL